MCIWIIRAFEGKGIDAEICYKGSIDKNCDSQDGKASNINVKEYISFEEFNKEDEIILVDAQR